MVFWKRFFNPDSSNSATLDMTGTEEFLTEKDDQSRVFFSTNREIDLYELEELCDSVG